MLLEPFYYKLESIDPTLLSQGGWILFFNKYFYYDVFVTQEGIHSDNSN
jgi:hypothetical protein